MPLRAEPPASVRGGSSLQEGRLQLSSLQLLLLRDQMKGSLGQCAPARQAVGAALKDSLWEQGLPRVTQEASGQLGPFHHF